MRRWKSLSLAGTLGLGLACQSQPGDRPAAATDSARPTADSAPRVVSAGIPIRDSTIPLDGLDFRLGGLNDDADSLAFRRVHGRPDSIIVEGHPFDPRDSIPTWYYADLTVAFVYGAARGLTVTGPRFATARGIRVGDAEARVLAAYGQPTIRDNGLTYSDPAQESHQMTFSIVDGRVTRIFFGTILD